MSSPLGTPARIDASTGDEESPESLGFTLIVVSPSTGVTSPLTFPGLSATTTVSQLKARIRDALPSKPSNESQRIIHRGRLLGRDADTMLDIFGRETLENPGPHTLHLVLRPTGAEHPLMHQYMNPSTTIVPPQRVTTPIPSQTRPQSIPANPIHGMHAQQPLPGFQHIHHHNALHQSEQLQNVTQRLHALHREAVRLQQEMVNIEQRFRALVTTQPEIFSNHQYRSIQAQGTLPGVPGYFVPPPVGPRPAQTTSGPAHNLPTALQHLMRQGQNERAAAEGRQAPQDLTSEANLAGLPRQTSSGRASPSFHRPDHTATYTREGVGPNGERWHMTVNETTSTIQLPQHPNHRQNNNPHVQGANPALDSLQALARNTDRLHAGQSVQNPQNFQNNVGAATYHPPPPANTAGHVPQTQFTARFPADTSAGIPRASHFPPPPHLPPPPPIPHFMNTSVNSAHGIAGSTGPIVYILSSPQGPQALLLQNSNMYYTGQTPRRRRNESPTPVIAGQAQAEIPAGLPEFRDEAAQRLPRRDNHHHQENNPLEPVGAAHANPGAGALGARLGPIIWLTIRLAGFVWFFTSGNTSWPRFVMITALAVVLFLINTGIFNGIAEALWGPIRRHVEALIPLAGPEAALVPAVNAAAIPEHPGPAPPANEPRARRRRHGELDEVEVAARLLEQRRQADGGWLLAQVRRAEHAALLFIASLVPGVGERHIAAREAEANAAEVERQRLAEAAAAAEDAERAAEAAESGSPVPGSEQTEGASQGDGENQVHDTDGAEGAAPAPPLVEI